MNNISPIKPNRTRDQIATEIILFLNEKTGKNFRPVRVNLDFVLARLAEGYTEAELRAVVVIQCREWKDDDFMKKYLRPATLFNREKFSQYAGNLESIDE